MKKRTFIYVVTGELRVVAKDEPQANRRVQDALGGLEWSLDHPTARLRCIERGWGPVLGPFRVFFYEI